MDNAAIYTRVSTDEQGKGYSLPTQLDNCRKYAAQRGYAVVAEFSDEFSGTEFDRPDLNELRKLASSGAITHLVVHDIDRLGRSMVYWLILEQELSGWGVRVEYVIGQYPDSPEGELMKNMKAAIAEYENVQRVERSRRGKRGRALAGFVTMPNGRAPFGYNYISEPHKGWLEINEEQAAVVRLMYRWMTEDGLSSYAIAKRLWEQGILSKGDFSTVVVKKTGRAEWSPVTIRRIISNPVYKGTFCWGKTRRHRHNGTVSYTKLPESEWIPVPVPAIVESEVWDEAQQCLVRNKQEAMRNTKRAYLLRGMVFCACGRRWTGRYKNHLGRAYYRCPTSEAEHWRPRCTMPGGIRQEILENAVWESVKSFLMDPTNLRAEIERRRLDSKDKTDLKVQRLGQISGAIKDIDRKMAILLDQLLMDELPRSLIDQHKKDLSRQRIQLQSEADRVQAELQTEMISTEQEEEMVAFAAQIAQGLEGVSFEEKRRILELIQLRVDVIDQKHLKLSGLIMPSGSVVDTSCFSPP